MLRLFHKCFRGLFRRNCTLVNFHCCFGCVYVADLLHNLLLCKLHGSESEFPYLSLSVSLSFFVFTVKHMAENAEGFGPLPSVTSQQEVTVLCI